jgi:hypothetical protein
VVEVVVGAAQLFGSHALDISLVCLKNINAVLEVLASNVCALVLHLLISWVGDCDRTSGSVDEGLDSTWVLVEPVTVGVLEVHVAICMVVPGVAVLVVARPKAGGSGVGPVNSIFVLISVVAVVVIVVVVREVVHVRVILGACVPEVFRVHLGIHSTEQRS